MAKSLLLGKTFKVSKTLKVSFLNYLSIKLDLNLFHKEVVLSVLIFESHKSGSNTGFWVKVLAIGLALKEIIMVK